MTRDTLPGRRALVARVLAPHLPAATADWLDDVLRLADDPLHVRALAQAFASPGACFGTGPLPLDDGERAALRALGVGDAPDAALLARVLLLAAVAEHGAPATLGLLVASCWREGDDEARRAVVRALPLLPEPPDLRWIALEAARGPSGPPFAALVCDNPYPVARLDDATLAALALRMLQDGWPLGRLVGLGARITPAMRRMAAALVHARDAEGRPVPVDAGRLLHHPC